MRITFILITLVMLISLAQCQNKSNNNNKSTTTEFMVEEVKNWHGDAVALPNPNPQTPPNIALIENAQQLNEYCRKYIPMAPIFAKFDFENYVYVLVAENASGCSASISGKATNTQKTNQLDIVITVAEVGNCEPLHYFDNCFAIKKPSKNHTYTAKLNHTYK